MQQDAEPENNNKKKLYYIMKFDWQLVSLMSRGLYTKISSSQTKHSCHSVPGGYKYGELALQVGRVQTITTIKYGLESLGTQTREELRW
jgi:hypothetical protein